MYCLHCMHKLPDDALFCSACGRKPTPELVTHYLRPGTVLHDRWLVGRALGEGGFGITYIGMDTTLDLKVAIKEFFPLGCANRNSEVSNEVSLTYSGERDYYIYAKDHFLQEAKSIAKFSKEEAIVDVLEYFTENNTAYIVMEYIDGMTLSRYIRTNSTFDAGEIISDMIPLMLAVRKMHREAVIHRDISPDNIMITETGALKLMDFGSARYYDAENHHLMSVVLKPGYAPMEQYSSKGYQGPWTDVYAICATIYKCITGVTPPDAMDRCQVDTLKTPSELGVQLPPALEKALMLGMEIYPQNRIQDISALITALSTSQTDIAAQDTEPEPRRTYGDPYTRFERTKDGGIRKKSNTALIVSVVIAALLIVGGVAAYFVTRPSTDEPSDNKWGVAVATEAPTEAPPTEAPILMPDVRGKKLSDAQSQLTALGLLVEVTREYSSTVAMDYVIRQGMDAGRIMEKGDTVMLYVSDGAPTEPPTDPPTEPPEPTLPYDFDVGGEVWSIRLRYLSVQMNPGKESSRNGATYYESDGHINKIVCDAGADDWEFTRTYYYDNNVLCLAVLNDGLNEYKLYFSDGILIRYLDADGSKNDYGSIDCPYEDQVAEEASRLAES